MQVWIGMPIMIGTAALLVACATAEPTRWVRTDGKLVSENASLTQQFEIDKQVCIGEMSKANLSGTQFCRGAVDCAVQSQNRGDGVMEVAKGCMAQRGYLLFPESVAVTKQAEFRAAAEAKAAQEAAAAQKNAPKPKRAVASQ